MPKIEVKIETTHPLYISADADAFGEVFSHMDSKEQVEVLSAMAKYMKEWPTQWDFISLELKKPENHEVREIWRNVLFPPKEDSE